MAKKLSTAEILARARGEDGEKSNGAKSAPDTPPPELAPESPPEASAAAEETPVAEAPVAEAPAAEAPAKPAAAPQSTKDKLAAARAEAAAKKAGAAAPAATPGGNGEKPAAAKPAGKPASAMTTAEKLAAMRAEAKSGGKKPTGTEVAPKAAKAAAKPLSAGERPSVQEMIKVAREGGGQPAAPAKREVRKPAAAAAARKAALKAEPDPQRRNAVLAVLLSPFVWAWVAFTMASTAFTLGMARFMMPNVLVEPPSKFKIGPPVNFPPDTVNTSFTAEYGVWVVNTLYNGKRMIYALRSVCTHLGCTPNWLDGEQKFKCPCHGSGFYITGINFEGPAPRPLERVGIALGSDGQLEVDKSVKFQQEMGQWEDETSFVSVA